MTRETVNGECIARFQIIHRTNTSFRRDMRYIHRDIFSFFEKKEKRKTSIYPSIPSSSLLFQIHPRQLGTNFSDFSYIFSTFQPSDGLSSSSSSSTGRSSRLITRGDPFQLCQCRVCPRFENSTRLSCRGPSYLPGNVSRVIVSRRYTGRYCLAGVINLSSGEDTLYTPPPPRWPRRVMIRGTHDNPPALVRHPCVSYGCPPVLVPSSPRPPA